MLNFIEKSLLNSSDIVIVCNYSGETLWKNKLAEETLSHEGARDLFVDPSDFDNMLEERFIGISDKTFSFKNGWLAHAVAVSFEDDDKYLVTFRDITDLILLTKENELVERVKAVGGLANNVAFDMATPLTVLLGRLSFLQAIEGGLDRNVRKQLRIIREHTNRISSTVSDLQMFASIDCDEVSQISPIALLSRSRARLLESDNTISVEFIVEPEIQAGDLQIRGDESLLQQALAALMESVAQSDVVGEIYAYLGKCNTSHCLKYQFQSVEPIIEDEEGWERLESSSTQALGFGVSVAVTIISYQGGVLFFRENNGSIIYKLALPIEDTGDSTNRKNGPSYRALLVDDEEGLLSLGKEILELNGHECHTVNTAEDALELLKTNEYNVVVTDVGLPGMSGLAFREVAVAKWPELAGKFVFVTGLSLSANLGVRLLQKPFTPNQLINVVDEVASEVSNKH